MRRVLVTMCGGVAEVFADEGVEVCVIDYDNDPDAVTPLAFAHLGLDRDESHGPMCAQRFHGAAECDCGKADGPTPEPQEVY